MTAFSRKLAPGEEAPALSLPPMMTPASGTETLKAKIEAIYKA